MCPAFTSGAADKSRTASVPDEVMASSVRVDGCSGTAIDFRGRSWVVTAAHCFKIGQKVHVVTGDRLKIGMGQVVALDTGVDLALVAIDRAKLTSRVTVPAQLPDGDWYGVGYPAGKGPQVWRGSFKGAERITNLPRSRWCFKLNRGRFRNGSSGSGVFRGGQLVAVATHMDDDDEEIFAAPLHDLQSFLMKTRSGKDSPGFRLAGLAKDGPAQKQTEPAAEGPAGWGDRDRTREILEIKEKLKNMTSKTGPAGPAGPSGPAGQPGPGMDQAQVEEILRRLESLETWTRDFRAIVRVRVKPKE